MVSDQHYELCIPLLQDPNLDDEDKTDQLENLLRKHTNLTGSALENLVLDVLWRCRDGGVGSTSPPPIRQSLFRRGSPAPWRSSPIFPAALPSPRLTFSSLTVPPGFGQASFPSRSSAVGSPFCSPRPSPRVIMAQAVPLSPVPLKPVPLSSSVNAYESTRNLSSQDPTPTPEILADSQIENVEWLVSEDAMSISSSACTPLSVLNAAAPEFSSSLYTAAAQNDMSPFDILRCILGQSRSDDEIEAALALNGYELSATIASIMEGSDPAPSSTILVTGAAVVEEIKTVLVGKSINVDVRPTTPVGLQKAGVICKFFLSTGQCLRSDCRFSHDLGNHLCKYWVLGTCLAGESCVFSHDPAQLVNNLAVEDARTPPAPQIIPLDDQSYFPSLSQIKPEQVGIQGLHNAARSSPPGVKTFSLAVANRPRSRSRPGSRHQMKEFGSTLAIDDADAFPTLGSGTKHGKKNYGKRGGHGHGPGYQDSPYGIPTPDPPRGFMGYVDENEPGTDDGGVALRLSSGETNGNGNSGGTERSGEHRVAAQEIPYPKRIPWLETGDRANEAYLKARQAAQQHGSLRNKFLQSAAQAWNRNDTRAAKTLSIRGSTENELMRQAHRKAATLLYEGPKKASVKGEADGAEAAELYVDLHGLQPEEAVQYLAAALAENETKKQPIYAITNSGQNSRSGKDKVSKAVRSLLAERQYVFEEFVVPSDRHCVEGIIGIETRPRKGADDAIAAAAAAVSATGSTEPSSKGSEAEELSGGVEIGDGRVRMLVRGPARGLSTKAV